jgi:hypothetical protein
VAAPSAAMAHQLPERLRVSPPTAYIRLFWTAACPHCASAHRFLRARHAGHRRRACAPLEPDVLFATVASDRQRRAAPHRIAAHIRARMAGNLQQSLSPGRHDCQESPLSHSRFKTTTRPWLLARAKYCRMHERRRARLSYPARQCTSGSVMRQMASWSQCSTQ